MNFVGKLSLSAAFDIKLVRCLVVLVNVISINTYTKADARRDVRFLFVYGEIDGMASKALLHALAHNRKESL